MESTPPPSPWFTLGNLTLLRYLYQFKPPPGVPMSEQIAQRYRHFHLSRKLFYTTGVLHVLRICYINYHLTSGGRLADQQPYAPLYTTTIESFHFFTPQTLLIVGGALILFTIGFDYLICFRIDNRILKIAHQLMIENGQQFLVLNRRNLGKKPKFWWRKPIHFLQKWSRLLKSVWSSNNNLQFKQSKLSELPNVSVQLRARLVVYSEVIDWVCYAWRVFAALANLGVVIFLVFLIYHRDLPLPIWFLGLLDAAFIGYCNVNAVRMGLFALHGTLLFAYLARHHLDQLNRQLHQVFFKGHHQRTHLSSFRGSHFLQYFYNEYAHYKAFAQHTNHLVVSPLFVIMFFTIMVLSIVLLSHLLFKTLLLSEQMFMWFIFTFIVTLPVAGCIALVYWSTSFYTSERILFWVQLMLTGSGGRTAGTLLAAKAQLLVFYEQICTRKRFRFTMGPFGHISKRALYEFAYAYSGMVIYVSGMIRDEQLTAQQLG